MTARAPSRLKAFVTRWEMAWHVTTIALYVAALVAVVWLFPDVSNTWVSIFVLVGSFTAAMAGMISAIKSKGETPERRASQPPRPNRVRVTGDSGHVTINQPRTASQRPNPQAPKEERI